MAEVAVVDGQVVVRLSGWERAAAFRGDVAVPVWAVRAVVREPRPWAALRGIRAPGTGWPGVIAYGVRRRFGERPDFCRDPPPAAGGPNRARPAGEVLAAADLGEQSGRDGRQGAEGGGAVGDGGAAARV